VDKQIAKAYTGGTVAYAQDAMAGLDLAKAIVNPEQFEQLKLKLSDKRKALAVPGNAPAPVKAEPKSQTRSGEVPVCDVIPEPPDTKRHVWLDTPSIEQVWPFINPMMLYGRHLGIKGHLVKQLGEAVRDKNLRRELEIKEPKALAVWDTVEEVKREYSGTPFMRPAAVWQFVPAFSDGNKMAHRLASNFRGRPRMRNFASQITSTPSERKMIKSHSSW